MGSTVTLVGQCMNEPSNSHHHRPLSSPEYRLSNSKEDLQSFVFRIPSGGGFDDKAMGPEIPPETVPFQPPIPHRGVTLECKQEAIIGYGAYGTVYKARNPTQPSKYVALKKVRFPINEDGVEVSTLREVALLRQLDRFAHPNIVRLLDVCLGPGHGGEQKLRMFLVFEFVEMDLSKYILKAAPDGLSGCGLLIGWKSCTGLHRCTE